MDKPERACAFDCPNCGRKVYIPVDCGSVAVTCAHCGREVKITQEMRTHLEIFKAISDPLGK